MDARVTARLWAKVDKNGPTVSHVADLGSCWMWTDKPNNAGYGCMRVGRKTFLAHRLAWRACYGVIPDGMCVCHRCDNPLCLCPKHLFLGTRFDNNQDKVTKGRQSSVVGELNPRARLTETDVLSIRALYAAGNVTHKELARVFCVSVASICMITTRRNWSHL